jgi:methylase of polypeptide subunit release factors
MRVTLVMPTQHDVTLASDARSVQHATFGGLDIAWDARVLEPREWTLEQSLWAARLLPDLPPGPVLELCSGAGQIGLRAVLDSDRPLVCVDANPVAATYTRENARAAGMEDRVVVRSGLIEEVLEPGEQFPMIIADPPWVPRDEITQFPEDPRLAIDGGSDGMEVVRTCVGVIADHLSPGGTALLQLGTGAQADLVGAMLQDGPVRAGRFCVFERGVVQRLDRPA